MFGSEKRETPYRGKAGAVLPADGLVKEAEKKGRKRFLAALEMTAWEAIIPYRNYLCLFRVLFMIDASRK